MYSISAFLTFRILKKKLENIDPTPEEFKRKARKKNIQYKTIQQDWVIILSIRYIAGTLQEGMKFRYLRLARLWIEVR